MAKFTTKQAKIAGMLDTLFHKNKEELLAEIAALATTRLLHGEDDTFAGRGDITTLQSIDSTIDRALEMKTITARSVFVQAWSRFKRETLGEFIKIDNECQIIGQDTDKAKAAAVAIDEETQAPRRLSFYRREFDKIVAEIKEERKAARKAPKTDLEKFLELAKTLQLDMEKVNAILPKSDEIPEIAGKIAA